MIRPLRALSDEFEKGSRRVEEFFPSMNRSKCVYVFLIIDVQSETSMY